jgi:hypothetical protein
MSGATEEIAYRKSWIPLSDFSESRLSCTQLSERDQCVLTVLQMDGITKNGF